MWYFQTGHDILCTTKTCIINPLKLQKVFCDSPPMVWPPRVIEADDRKLIAIQKSLIASPLLMLDDTEQRLQSIWLPTELVHAETISSVRITNSVRTFRSIASGSRLTEKLKMIHPAPSAERTDTMRITKVKIWISLLDEGADKIWSREAILWSSDCRYVVVSITATTFQRPSISLYEFRREWCPLSRWFISGKVKGGMWMLKRFVSVDVRVGAITLRPPKRDHDFQHSHFNELL